MIIYKEEQRFDSKTGVPKIVKVCKEYRCDYSGEIIDDDAIYCTYELNYGCDDPCFGSWPEEYEFGKNIIYMFINFYKENMLFCKITPMKYIQKKK